MCMVPRRSSSFIGGARDRERTRLATGVVVGCIELCGREGGGRCAPAPLAWRVFGRRNGALEVHRYIVYMVVCCRRTEFLILSTREHLQIALIVLISEDRILSSCLVSAVSAFASAAYVIIGLTQALYMRALPFYADGPISRFLHMYLRCPEMAAA